MVKALDTYERTRRSDELKELMSKQFGEIFEGAAAIGGLTTSALKDRVRKSNVARGVFPKGALFITAAIDVAKTRFDVGFWAWDLEGRSWLIDRLVIRQRLWADGKRRDLATRERIEDWMLLIDEVVDRRFPIDGRDGWEMPVAITCIDVGDGNVLPVAAEFQRRAMRGGAMWSPSWSKTKLIKGNRVRTAEILPPKATPIDKDESGKAITPTFMWVLGVHKAKELAMERLALVAPEPTSLPPGYCQFAAGIEATYLDELLSEHLVDGEWVKRGIRNETLDLFNYAEAGRLMLKPDNPAIRWDRPPAWAKPIRTQDEEGGDPAVAGEALSAPARKKTSIYEQFDSMNRSK